MKPNLNKLYHYIYGDWADIEKYLKKDLPPEAQEKFFNKRKKEIKDFFSESKDALLPIIRAQKNTNLEKILFDSISDAKSASPSTIPETKAIGHELKQLDKKFGLLTDEKGDLSSQSYEMFHAYFKIAKLIADKIEHNNDAQNSVAYFHAYKMLVLFGDDIKSFVKVDKHLEQHSYLRLDAPLHDALIYPLPTLAEDKIHLNDWRKLIQKEGPKLLKLFNLAPAIEKYLGGRCPSDLKEAQEAASCLSFKRAKENPKLAELFLTYNLDEKIFDRTLEVDKHRKKKDILPAIKIHGSDINEKFSDYHLIKLPIDDPIAYLLGCVTNCCQSMGGHSEYCVIDGVTREKNGFYVLLKSKIAEHKREFNPAPMIAGKINYEEYEIVGQGYAWLSQQGNLVFDSWENKNTEHDDQIIIPFLETFAHKVAEQKDTTILRVMIGIGGKTPALLTSNKTSHAEIMAEGKQYGDSRVQSTIFCNETLRDSHISELKIEIDKLLSTLKRKDWSQEALNFFLTKQISACYSKLQTKIIKSILTNVLTDEYLKDKDAELIFNIPGLKKIPFASILFLKQNDILTEKNLHLICKIPNIAQGPQDLTLVLLQNDILTAENASLISCSVNPSEVCQALVAIKNAEYKIDSFIFERLVKDGPATAICRVILDTLSRLKEEKLEMYFTTLYCRNFNKFKDNLKNFKLLLAANLIEDTDLVSIAVRGRRQTDHHQITIGNFEGIVKTYILLREKDFTLNGDIKNLIFSNYGDAEKIAINFLKLKEFNLYPDDVMHKGIFSSVPSANHIQTRQRLEDITNAFELLKNANIPLDVQNKLQVVNASNPFHEAENLIETMKRIENKADNINIHSTLFKTKKTLSPTNTNVERLDEKPAITTSIETKKL